MRKKLLALAALAMTVTCLAPSASALDITGYDSDMYAAQSSYDAFNKTIKNRLSIARFGALTNSRGMAIAPLMSDSAYGQTTRYSSSRQIDCVYNNGFTVWGSGYGSWAHQKSKGGHDGYKYRVAGPAIGFDWSNGAFTAGIATTYNWGKIQGRHLTNSRNTRTFAVAGYGQYNHRLFYVNADFGYGRNTYRKNHRQTVVDGFILGYNTSGNYHSNAYNFNTEFGWKFNLASGFSIVPHLGLRYFHDKRKSFGETGTLATNLYVDGKNYHTFELPIGVDFGYEIRTAGMVLRPHINLSWVPELDRKRGRVSYSYYDYVNSAWGSNTEKSASRGRHAFNLGAGFQAKFTDTISANLDYNLELRDKRYEHTLTLGLGFTF